MKKIFTLIAVAFCAISVNAQETLAISADETYQDGQELTTENCTVKLGNDQKKWTVKADASLSQFTAYVSGGNNAKDDDGKGYTKASSNLPTTGTYYVITPKSKGTLEVGVVLNASKPFFVVKSDGTALDNSDLTLTDKNGNTVTLDDDNKVEEKLYGTVKFNADEGQSYYVFCTGSKLGFYGYVYTGDATGISAINATTNDNAPIYNLAGQKVSKDYKGVVVKNGKKYVNK